jgi:hypothetical protein
MAKDGRTILGVVFFAVGCSGGAGSTAGSNAGGSAPSVAGNWEFVAPSGPGGRPEMTTQYTLNEDKTATKQEKAGAVIACRTGGSWSFAEGDLIIEFPRYPSTMKVVEVNADVSFADAQTMLVAENGATVTWRRVTTVLTCDR